MNTLEKTKSFWSTGFAARFYRAFAGKHYLRMHQKITEKILAQHAKDILDIACGPGDFLFYLSNRAPDLHLIGTDIAPGMVQKARKKLFGKAKILESDGENYPFPENSFDAITIMMAFHHFSKKLETLERIKKLLRPHGLLIIADVIAQTNIEKKFWNFLEKLTSVRGYVDHYTESDIRTLAEKTDFSFSSEYIPKMPKRYKMCTFRK